MRIKKYFKMYLLLPIIISLFTGCSALRNLKEDIKFSFYSQEKSKNLLKDKQVLNLYKKNFVSDKITSFNNERFLKKYGKTGLWLPYKFIKNIGGGVYFLTKYDSQKIPVLFIHGAGGTPLDWEYISRNLDNTKYQKIVVSYPSGIKLSYTVQIMEEKIQKLISKYNMDNLVIIAHSMGGLVAKSLIKELNTNKKIVNLFITLSTPWNGHLGASNTKELPYYIPSWDDMKKNSKFIKSLKDTAILKNVKHYLFFGYKGKTTIYGRDNDGTISLESQLSDYAQDAALRIFGFNDNHTSILSSRKVAKKINIILNDKL